MATMHGGSGKGIGGVFSGIKTFFGDLMSNESDLIGPDEYLEDSVDDTDLVMEVSDTVYDAHEEIVFEESRESAMGFAEIEETAEPEMKAEEGKAETKKVENKSDSGSFGRASFVNPVEFFSTRKVNTTENKGETKMANETKVETPAYGTAKKSERVGSVGFNYSQTSNEVNGSSAGRTFAAQKTGSPVGTIVQFFEPRDTKQADDICTVLKAGHIVVVNLCNIREESDKIRIIDFVAGCCKGIDAKAHTVAPKSIFIAAPKGVELRKPVDYTQEAPVESNQGAPFFGGLNFNGTPGGERNINSFEPRI